MRLIKLTVIIFTCFFFIQSSSNAQLKIVLGPAIGLTVPTGDYSGETTEYYAGTKYALGTGVNFGAMGKIYLGPINFNIALMYSPLSKSGTADATIPNTSVEIKQNLFTIAVGTQIGIGIPLVPVRPYFGLDLLFTSISGSSKFQGTSKVPSSTIDMATTWRTGLGTALGVGIKVSSIDIDLSLRYNFINLFSKSYEGLSTGNRDEAYKYLNDDKDPNYSATDDKHPIGSSRAITTIQFQLGVLFGL